MRRLPPTAWVMTERIFAQGFGLAVFAVQAPLLGPHAFGLLAAVMVFVGFLDAVAGAAAIDALLSIRQIEQLHYSTVTAAMAGLGVALGIFLLAVAGPFAAALGDPHMIPVMQTMAALPLIQGLSIVPNATAQHEMLFKSLTIRTIASQLVGGVVGIGAAVAGAGVWALVWQALVQRGVAAVILWVAVPSPLSLAFSLRHFRELLHFALPNIFSRVMAWASGQVPRLIIGLVLGPTSLGLFTFATRLNDVVTQVAILPKPMVARVDLRRFASTSGLLGPAVERVVLHASVLSFPLCIGGAVIMTPLVNCWLDPRWRDAIVPAQILLLMGLPFVTIYTSASVLLALNKQRWEAAICTAQCLVTASAVAAAAYYGVISAAAAMALAALLTVPPIVIVLKRFCGVSLTNMLAPQAPALISAIVMAAAILAARWVFEAGIGDRIALPLEITLGLAVYASTLMLLIPREVGSAFSHFSHMVISKG